MDAQAGSRALNAANDLVEMLRLAQSAAERVAQELYGVAYEHAELIERELQRLRRSADRMQKTVEDYVSREEGASVERGQPMRRAGDHH